MDHHSICSILSETYNKIGQEKSELDFMELVNQCAIQCQNPTVDFCRAVAIHLDQLAEKSNKDGLSAVYFTTKLYAITLWINTSVTNFDTRGGSKKKKKTQKVQKDGANNSIKQVLSDIEDKLNALTPMFNSLASGFAEQIVDLTPQRDLPEIYKPWYFTAVKLLCEPLSKLINIKHEDILGGIRDIQFPNIHGAFRLFRLHFHYYSESEDVHKKSSQTAHAVAVASFTLSFTSNKKDKGITELLTCPISQVDHLKCLISSLDDVTKALQEANREEEASQAQTLCCQATWKQALHFCRMYANRKHGGYTDLSQKATTDHVIEACGKSAKALNMLCNNKMILSECLNNWCLANTLLPEVPLPKDVLRKWVEIQCTPRHKIRSSSPSPSLQVEERVPIIYSLISSSPYASSTTLESFNKEELELYEEMKSRNQILSKTMIEIITSISEQHIDTEMIYRDSISEAYNSRAEGDQCLEKCMGCITRAISVLDDYTSNDRHPTLDHLLAEAYCLQALCAHEAEPSLKAIKIWSRPPTSKSTDMVSSNAINLMCYVAHFLSIKGYHSPIYGPMISNIYDIMIRSFSWKDVSLKECLAILWQSKSIGYPLCTSPINDAFETTLSNHCKPPEALEFLKSCMKNSISLGGFEQSFMIMPTLSTHPTQPQFSIDDVKHAASRLLNDDPDSNNTWFIVANLYYDLGERMMASGLIVEALSYAIQADSLRTKLLSKMFNFSKEQLKNPVGDARFDRKCFCMHPQVATGAWPSIKGSSDFDECILTPWNVLRCHLESTLQMGTIQEMVGNGSEAERHLLWGKKISAFQELRIFSTRFSCALGKLYRKQQCQSKAHEELDIAKRFLQDTENLMCCKKCDVLLRTTVCQEYCDQVSTSKAQVEKNLTKAKNTYLSAAKNLSNKIWKNDVSYMEVSSKHSVFCSALPIIDHVAASDCQCWHCLPFKIMKSSSLTKIIRMKWECIRRRHLLRLLTGLGKCYLAGDEIESTRDVLMRCISLLVGRNTFPLESSISSQLLTELIEKSIVADMFAIEHATILYDISWIALKSFCTRKDEDGCLTIRTAISGLKLCFILSRQVPELFKQVSRLLSVLYALSPSNEAFSVLSSDTGALSLSQWASFFHQASVGSCLQKTSDVEGCCSCNSVLLSLPRLAPASVSDLEKFILKFFQDLPHVAIICISMLGVGFVGLLRELVPSNPRSPTQAWMMLSRLNSDNIPVLLLLPIDSIPVDLKGKKLSWTCYWDHSIVDEVAPEFQSILSENQVTMKHYAENDPYHKTLWWKAKEELDERLSNLLSCMEEKWFGQWISLLLGDCNLIDSSVVVKLKEDLEKCSFDAHESILKLAIGVAKHASQGIECSLDLVLNKGCYIRSNNVHERSTLVSNLIQNVVKQIKDPTNFIQAEPVIFVLDTDIQMLPWENLPYLRKQEVYRMPSVASISLAYAKFQEKFGQDWPNIDPTSAYYLLNPSMDLKRLEKKMGTWLRDKGFKEGKAGAVPTLEEIKGALKTYDLFLYFGHRDGLTYIPAEEIRSIRSCGAAMLFGCISCLLKEAGPYRPTGAPLEYLDADSP